MIDWQWITQLDSAVYCDGLAIRQRVFIVEQQVPEALEIDELEAMCHYVTGYRDQRAVATGRIYPKQPHQAKFQRIAVEADQRGQRIGALLLQEMERYAQQQGFTEALLDAQDHALAFYEKAGYEVCSEGFYDAGIPHHTMRKVLTHS